MEQPRDNNSLMTSAWPFVTAHMRGLGWPGPAASRLAPLKIESNFYTISFFIIIIIFISVFYIPDDDREGLKLGQIFIRING